MKIITLLIAISFIQCGSNETVKATETPKILCNHMTGNTLRFSRCENDEVICYSNNSGLSCYFK